MKFQKLYLMFVKSQWSADWHLNVATQMQLIKYVFAFDRTNYSRWMTVSVHKDQQMPEVHPEVFKEFEDGRFVLQKIISYYYYDLKSPNVPYTRVLALKSTTSTIHKYHHSRYIINVNVFRYYFLLYSYARYKKDRDSSNRFEELLEDENERSDIMALYWSMLVRFQLLFLTFLRSIREGNWNLNVACHLWSMWLSWTEQITADGCQQTFMLTDNSYQYFQTHINIMYLVALSFRSPTEKAHQSTATRVTSRVMISLRRLNLMFLARYFF